MRGGRHPHAFGAPLRVKAPEASLEPLSADVPGRLSPVVPTLAWASGSRGSGPSLREPRNDRGRARSIAWLAFALHLLLAAPALAQSPLRIATEGAYPPFNYVENGEPAGFEPELARALCDAMGRPCQVVLQDWDSLWSGLKAGRYDAVMSSMEITDERRRRYTFTRPYYRIPSALLGPKDAPKGAPDLAGRTVGVAADGEFAAYLAALPRPPEVRTYGKLEEANLDLLTGRIEFTLGDKLAQAKFLETREGAGCCRRVADLPVDRGEGYAVALRLGDDGLRVAFDRALGRVLADGRYDAIRARHVPFDIAVR